MNKQITVAFDVDGTLIGQDYQNENIPLYENIQLFKMFEKLGCTMFIWSGGGTDYAERWAQKLGLKAKIVIKGSFIPDFAVDDIAAAELGTITLQVEEAPVCDIN